MKFKNIVKIEGDITIPMTEKYMYAGPMPMVDIEFYEDRIDTNKQNYLLAQVDTTVDGTFGPRYIKGYCLFVRDKKN